MREAVAAAHSAYVRGGGGVARVVMVTNGTYVSGQVELLSGVHLHVSPTATLLASSDLRNFPGSVGSDAAGVWGVVYANGARNIGLVGGGTVDGAYSRYIARYDDVNKEFVPRGWPGCPPTNNTSVCRPKLVFFRSSTDVLVDEVMLTGSAFWTFHLLNCSRVRVTGIRVRGDARFPNNDGIDIDSSQHVALAGVDIDTADDGICIKSTRGMQETFDVSVHDATIRSRSSAIKFGSTTPADIGLYPIVTLEKQMLNMIGKLV
jgi:polygalacturonase